MNKLLVVIALMVALAGCSAASDAASSTTSSTAATSASPPSVTFKPATRSKAEALARCLRAHGVTVAGPEAGTNQVTVVAGYSTDAQLRAAQKACQAYGPPEVRVPTPSGTAGPATPPVPNV